MLAPLWAVTSAITQQFPAGNEPFQIIARLAEECGELAQQVNHAEDTGHKRQKYGAPDPQKMSKEVLDVVRCALQVAQYYNLEQTVEAVFLARLQASVGLEAIFTTGQTINTTASRTSRPRVSAAVLRADKTEILMVQHLREDGTRYWQLPGGGVLPGELPEVAVLRELWEETGVIGRGTRQLFTIPYTLGMSTTFLVEVSPDAQIVLGMDPEEQAADHKKLVDVAWCELNTLQTSPEVQILRIVLSYL